MSEINKMEESEESVFELKSIEEIQEMGRKELIDYIMKSSTERKSFKLIKNRIPIRTRLKSELTIQDIGGFYDLEKRIKECEYAFPYLDERKLPRFRHTVGGKKQLPGRGWFWVVDTEIIERPFGLVETVTFVAAVRVKPNDTRFELVKRLEIDEKFFYYKYDEGIYKQINKKADNEDTKEYFSREKKIHAAYEKLTIASEVYVRYLDYFFRKTYNVVGNLSNTIHYLDFFEEYITRLETIEPIIPLKLIFSHVDTEEYKQIQLFMNTLKRNIAEAKKEIGELYQIPEVFKVLRELKTSVIDFKNDEIKKVIKFEKIENEEGEMEEVIKYPVQETYQFLREIEIKCKDFVRVRPEYGKSKKGESEDMRGYISLVDGRLFPSLLTVESRRTYTIYPSNEEKIKSLEERIIKKFNSEETMKEVEEKKYGKLHEIFDDDEIKKLEKLKFEGKTVQVKMDIRNRMTKMGIKNDELKIYIKEFLSSDLN